MYLCLRARGAFGACAVRPSCSRSRSRATTVSLPARPIVSRDPVGGVSGLGPGVWYTSEHACSVRMSESERDDPVGGRGQDPGPPGGQDPGPPGGVVMSVASLRVLADEMPKPAEPREAPRSPAASMHPDLIPPDCAGSQGPSQCFCSQRGARADAPVSGPRELVSSVLADAVSRGGVCRSDRFYTPE